MKRRQFIKSCLAYSSLLSIAATSGFDVSAAAPSYRKRTLLLVELNGGNDGLNTVIPYADPTYKELRPNLAIGRDRVIQLDETLGLHPALSPLMGHWHEKDLAIALGVGYPAPNLSHFRSIDIWDQASESHEYLDEGWISQAFDEHAPSNASVADGVVLGRNNFGPLAGEKLRTIALKTARQLKAGLRMAASEPSTLDNLALQHVLQTGIHLKKTSEALVARQLEAIDLSIQFPDTSFGQQLQLAARLILSGSEVPVIKASIGSFDTHGNQASQHQRLLKQLADGLKAFSDTMKKHGIWDQVLIMTYSEFGRRPRENNSRGTDHGTSAPHFILGGRIRGGFYGSQPPLNALIGENLDHRVHFKQLYASIAQEWWGLEAKFLNHPPLNCIS